MPKPLLAIRVGRSSQPTRAMLLVSSDRTQSIARDGAVA
jgi:hypothetical protein